MQRIGFIGLGIMGSRMAANLLKQGYSLTVYNRSKEKASELLENGAKWGASPKEVAQNADIVITMLSTPEVVRSLAKRTEGFLSAMTEGSIWLNCSTVNPSFSEEMQDLAWQQGVKYLDAPVAGTRGPAEKGELLFLLGGEKADMDRVQPLLDVMGKKTIYLGKAGQGSKMKMLINLLLGQAMLAFSEAMVLGEELGLSQETLFNVLLNAPVTAPFLSMVKTKLETSDYEANFPLQWMQKDIHLATHTAYEHNIAMPSLNIAKEVFALARRAGYGEKDFSSIYDYLKSRS